MTKKIWIVDDDKLYTLLLTKTIRKISANAIIDNFANGEEAIVALKNSGNLPDLIFLDINMPIMDGWEFLNAYIDLKKTMAQNIHIYAVSSSINNSDREKALRFHEIAEYLIKPIKNEKLVEMLGL